MTSETILPLSDAMLVKVVPHYKYCHRSSCFLSYGNWHNTAQGQDEKFPLHKLRLDQQYLCESE